MSPDTPLVSLNHVDVAQPHVYQSAFLMYQMFDHQGRALYIGIIDTGAGRTFDERFAEHSKDRRNRAWCPSQVDPGRTRFYELGVVTRAEAEDIERAQIEKWLPLANIEFNPNANLVPAYINQLRAAKQYKRVEPQALPGDGFARWLSRHGELVVFAVLVVLVIFTALVAAA